LNTIINTGNGVSRHPYISKDGNTLLLETGDGSSNDDIFVSFNKKNVGWSIPIDLGKEINTSDFESQPTLSPDEKYLFFRRGLNKGIIFWVQIDELLNKLRKQAD
jgi:hypothetical protein